ncbi:hypothetical protein CHCC20372_2388 [Bacillus paralicheniformis]|nr:hypothetical protein CHCC5027_1415 [Bacillus paralicheniformis]TWK24860.1 hypothetical protein CHCC20372_2388 [Bacillus paralicheniformis]
MDTHYTYFHHFMFFLVTKWVLISFKKILKLNVEMNSNQVKAT